MKRSWWTIAGVAVAVVVLGNLALDRLAGATSSPGGPTSSSYATGADGLAAYAELLARGGHPVSRLREPPAEAELDPAATLVVLDPVGLTASDGAAVRRFLDGGGRLVAGGVDPERWLGAILAAPSWSDDSPGSLRTLVPAPELARVGSVRADGPGSWTDTGGALPVLGSRGAALLATAAVGSGRALLLADASLLQNQLLDDADNAALGLALAGEPGRRVVFAESVHGYGDATGVRAIPARWWWALGGLVLAALTWMVARGRRLGPPEREERELPPPRREFVEALGGLLARTRDVGAAGSRVQAEARSRLASRLGLPAGATPDELRAAAVRAGLPPEETSAALEPVRDERALVAAGRALASLRAGGGGA